MAVAIVEDVQCFIKRSHARCYLEAAHAQHSFHIKCDKWFILDNENPRDHSTLPLLAPSSTTAAGALIRQSNPVEGYARLASASSPCSTMRTRTLYPKPCRCGGITMGPPR